MKKNRSPLPSTDSPRLYLVDAHAYLHKGHNAISGLATHDGMQTGALYGLARILLGIIKKDHPDYLCVCFDSPGPTLRHREFKEYKANRPELDEGLRLQLTLAREMVEAMGIRFVEASGYEADDLMATLARRGEEKGLGVWVVTPDKDVLQLVDSNIRVVRDLKQPPFDPSRVLGKYQVAPERLVDFFALVGDSVDNIEGVPGIGDVRAAQLLNRYGDLQSVMEEALNPGTSLPVKLAASLRESSERVLLNRKLLALDTHAPVSLEPEDCRVRPPDRERVLDLFRRLEFFSLLKEVLPDQEGPPRVASGVSEEEMLRFLDSAAVFSIAASSEGISVGLEDGRAAYVPWERASSLIPYLSHPGKKKVGHDLKSLLLLLRSRAIPFDGPWEDTALAWYCLDPSRTRYGFGEMVLERLGKTVSSGQGAEGLLEQARLVWPVWDSLEKELNENGLKGLLEDLEIPLVAVLADMESEGIGVDEAALKSLAVEFKERIRVSKEELDRLAGMEINLNSPKQLSVLLFERLNLPVIRKTKTGYSTDEEVLRTLSAMNPIPAKIIEYRELTKLKSAYIDNLLEDRRPDTGRVHTRFNQTGTSTGRLSSLRPNLQNIPIRSPLGQRIRRVFVPRGDCVFVSADYSQIDLRVLAHVSGDAALRRAFEIGQDIHLQTACEVFRLKPDQVESEMRRRAKAINFGVVYGQTPHGLSQELGITHQEAQRYIQKYFDRYPGIKRWIEENLKTARASGCVRTILGRIRYLPELKSSNPALRGFAERAAVNTPIQGSSADIIKQAMIRIHRRLKSQDGNEVRMVLQVHDELLFEIPEDRAAAEALWIKSEMENAVRLSVPVRVDLKTGLNWQDMGSVKGDG